MFKRILLTLSSAGSLLTGAAGLVAVPVDGPKRTTTEVDAFSTDRFKPIVFQPVKRRR